MSLFSPKLSRGGLVAAICLAACSTLSAQYVAPSSPYASYEAVAPAYDGPYEAHAGLPRHHGEPRTVFQAIAHAAHHCQHGHHWHAQPQPYCRPGYPAPHGYTPYPQHSPAAPMQPQQPATSADAKPQAPGRQEQKSEQESQTQREGEQNQQAQTPQDQQQQQQQDFTPSPESSGRASLTPGASTPQLGRNDQTNRLNLFDNMAAAPQTRIWGGFQYSGGFDSGLKLTDAFQSFLHANPFLDPDEVLELNQGVTTDTFLYNQNIYRMGGEWAPCKNLSIAIQGQYYQTHGDAPPDHWTNPQVMLKMMAYCDCDSVVSATVGVTTQIDSNVGVINEGTTKIYPGMLFYQGLSHDLFVQGGWQIGVPTDEVEIYTADWSLSLGYWLYRDESPWGPGCCDRPHCLRTCFVKGLIPQFNVLGKHVLGTNRIVGPFRFSPSATSIRTSEIDSTPFFLPEGFIVYEEPQAVVDMTVEAAQVLLGDHVQVGAGYSFPVTGGVVRDNEFLSTLTLTF